MSVGVRVVKDWLASTGSFLGLVNCVDGCEHDKDGEDCEGEHWGNVLLLRDESGSDI